MTDSRSHSETIKASLKRRNAAERRFRFYGMLAISFAVACLGILFFTILSKGISAFQQTYIQIDIHFDSEQIDPKKLADANYQGLVKKSLRGLFPEVKSRRDKKDLYKLVSSGASYELLDMVRKDPSLIGKNVSVWVTADDDVDMFAKGFIPRELPENERRISNKELSWIDKLLSEQRVKKVFNTTFFSAGDSREPELSGVWGAAVGSFFTLLVTLILAFPLGVAGAIYLEEFAPKNRLTDMIEVNINNLAAVPSIVFGLLGLAIFLNFLGMPRSAPLVGGVVLALMTLPTIIIAARAALKSVPQSIREAAVGLGASRNQVVFHHVLPLAMPGVLTGTIIGMARALGETAPLLMIGMVAFIVDIPGGITDPATALPVQIYLWADSPERAFVERTSAAVIVLVGFLMTMNVLAAVLRKKFERQW
ncbi:MAG: phosphate ABC transporter permease PstA [Pseudomonadota bacterium]|nr:phosphate ABC transporter permease PstA [Pseudomonadota bacterium]MEC8726515.1 phosphate ABC transporter permease PstA [Pseudomonadota bacterium]